jgi:hypothetical protein
MLTRTWKSVGLLVLTSGAAAPGALAQKPATVSVRVELVSSRYRTRFTNRAAVEAKAATVFADYLTRNVGFLRFAPDDSTRPFRLSFLLDRPDRGSSGNFSEVGFWVRLDRPGEAPVESYWLQLRPADQSLTGVGTELGFLAEIKAKLEHQPADSLRGGILRWVPISETGLLPDLTPPILVLPFRLLDLCMKNQSVVQFLAELTGTVTMELPYTAQIVGTFAPPSAATPDIEPFRGGGIARVMELTPPDDLASSIARHTVKVKKIFVTSYVHDPTACGNRAPAMVGGGAP